MSGNTIWDYPLGGPKKMTETTTDFYMREIKEVEECLKYEKKQEIPRLDSIRELEGKLDEYQKKLSIAINGTCTLADLVKFHNLGELGIARTIDEFDETNMDPWESEEDWGLEHDEGTEVGDLENDNIEFDGSEVEAILNPTSVKVSYDNSTKTYSIYMCQMQPYFQIWRITSEIRFNVYKKEVSSVQIQSDD
jgi:hypothetical protein